MSGLSECQYIPLLLHCTLLLFLPVGSVRYSNSMMIMLSLLGVGLALEVLLLAVPLGWRMRRPLAVVLLLVHGFSAGFIMSMWGFSAFSITAGALGLYRVGNMIRIIEGRMHEGYLRRAVRRSAVWLALMQVAVIGCWLLWREWLSVGFSLWPLVALGQAAVAATLLATTLRRMRRTAWPAVEQHYSDAELPTLTVAIPARNETEVLHGCLQSLVASNYPKLEIIVLDDCSQTRRTPEIIRDFAHEGVRFIKGEEPDPTWLAKNQAYDRLADEATGQYILFCGVDIRFTPTALRTIVGAMLYREKQMLSLLPERAPEVRGHQALAQAMRYLWELVPPRRLFKRPPVLSSCWIVTKELLKQAGRFDAVRRSIVPEAHFARMAAATESYSFMRAGINPGVSSLKGAVEQHETAVRMRYPQLHRRPENVFALAVAEVLFILLPFVLALCGGLLDVGTATVLLAWLAVIMLTITYGVVVHATKLGSGLFTAAMLPVVVLHDMWVLHRSMWRYEFSEVAWKGRNVCVPAMHVIPRLPKI